MEKTIVIKFSSGKEILLSEDEYNELIQGKQQTQIPYYGPYWWQYNTTIVPWVRTGNPVWVAAPEGVQC